MYFPRIALTGDYSYQSTVLSNLISSPSTVWTVAANLTQPLFTGRRITSQVELAKAQKEEAVIHYQQAALQAFREVNDVLFAHRKTREGREVETRLVVAARQAFDIAQRRWGQHPYSRGSRGRLIGEARTHRQPPEGDEVLNSFPLSGGRLGWG